jgi:DNA modification methylase
MGSGTTAVACKKNNINWIGSELNPTHYENAIKRINDLG